jgi:protein SCO1/2
VITLWVLAGALALATAPRPAHPHSPAVPSARLPASPLAPNPSLGIIRQAPDFTLLDHEGRVVRLSDFKGRVVLLSFIYASCPGACPLVTGRVAALQAQLRAAGAAPSRVGLLSITVDPERDTGPVLARYARAFGAVAEGWRFLTETPERVRPVLAAYDEWTRREAGGDLDHPARLYLIDPRGYIREIYSLSLFDERQALLDIQALLRESR